MLTSVRVEAVSERAIQYIARNMRAADIAEVKASTGATPMESIRNSVAISDMSMVLVMKEIPVAIFGLVYELRLLGGGVPWLLGTNDIDKSPFSFVKTLKKIVGKMLETAPLLMNYVHEENHRSIRTLKVLGFTIGEKSPIGINKEMFYSFRLGEE